MEVINEIFGKDIGGLIWDYGKPRYEKEIEVDIEKIRVAHMCPECKTLIDTKEKSPYELFEDGGIDYHCLKFCWQDYDSDLAEEYALESYEYLYPKQPKKTRTVKKLTRKKVSI